jgi:glycerate kinase
MRCEVLIAPDKFKGTLIAGEAAMAIARGWSRTRPGDKLVLLPMSDGGDGFGEVISSLLGASVKYVKTVDAAHRPHVAKWWWEPGTKTAIIESANVIGLAMLAPQRFHPSGTDTFGLGAVIKAARASGAKRWLVGIGGSATNDGGFGMARALGWRFLNARGQVIEKWIGLRALRKICAPSHNGSYRNLVVAVDVQNPLLGARGATRIYGPQKGLRAQDFTLAESCLRQLGRIIPCQPGENFVSRQGAGAAGGLGFGFLAWRL